MAGKARAIKELTHYKPLIALALPSRKDPQKAENFQYFNSFGDSGSGLVTQIEGRTVLVGIVSFGDIRCQTGSEHPAVFTRVSSYLDWIDKVSKEN